MEKRQLLSAAPIQIGAVYYEDASGFDEIGDLLEVTYLGGAPGTQLTRLVIETDKLGDGLTIGDVFFDTEPGGPGAYNAFPLTILNRDGIDAVDFSVADGGTTLVLTFQGFDPGEKLVFTVDVDEMGFLGANAVAEGNEFEGSRMTAVFAADHYFDAIGTDIFLDFYDAKLALSGLDLPPDDYVPPAEEPRPVRTAGAIFSVQQQPLPASIAGTVFEDMDIDNVRDPGDSGIPGVRLVLLELQGEGYVSTGRSTTTDALGNYRFEDLLPGTYRVVETQPDGYFSVGAKAGVVGGTTRGTTSGPDIITDVSLLGGEDSTGNDFAEARPASISGRVFADADADCLYDPGEPLLVGVTIELWDPSGNVLLTTTTDSLGAYAFTNLRPGVYGVHEVQPEGYLDSCDFVGSAGGTLLAPDAIVGISLGSGEAGVRYDFAEIEPARFCGFVYADENANGVFDPGEPGIPGVLLTLLDADGQPTALTVTTDSAGHYCFSGLLPGTYGVAEQQPAGYLDGLDTAGTAGGTAHNPGDRITGITLPPGTHGQHYNFGELRPASISGFVYEDDNDNGVRNLGEAPIAGVILTLLDAEGQSTGQTATTDANGYYEFTNLMPGVYGVAEAQPAGYFDGRDSAGTAGGTALHPGDQITGATLTPGTAGKNYNFGEIRPSSISGQVWVDLNDNGLPDPGEPPLPGVTVYLLNASNARIASTTTNDQGQYRFTDLRPGIFGVEEVQPEDYIDGQDRLGSAGGDLANDRVTQVKLPPGTHAVDYDFGELPPASIAGYVFQDGPAIRYGVWEPRPDFWTLRDGQFTADDVPLAGVELQLGDGTGAPLTDRLGRPITTQTDAQGYYEFTGLAPGTYTVLEVHPAGYEDGIDTPGSNGGVAFNPNQPVDPAVLARLTVDPKNDAITLITLKAGDAAVQYNFSEVLVVQTPPPSPPPLPPPPPRDPPVPPAPPMGEPPPLVLGYPSGPALVPTGSLFGGGLGPAVWTWHLSVINAGQPRRLQDGVHVLTEPEISYFNPALWNAVDLTRGEWLILLPDGKPGRTVSFGMEGATPLTGDFNGDGRDEVALFFEGMWFIDLNGNGVWDEGDLWARLGKPGDRPVTGDWDGDGKTDIGIFGPSWPGDERAVQAEPGLPDAQNPRTGRYKNIPPEPHEAALGWRTMQRTAEGQLRADLIDHVFHYGSPEDVPVTGDWNGDGVTNIGLFRDGTWYLDADGNGQWSPGDVLVEGFGRSGDIPLVGDWNGDGIDDLGVFRSGTCYLDSNGNRRMDPNDQVLPVGNTDGVPVAGDFDGDGTDEVSLYRPAQGPIPKN